MKKAECAHLYTGIITTLANTTVEHNNAKLNGLDPSEFADALKGNKSLNSSNSMNLSNPARTMIGWGGTQNLSFENMTKLLINESRTNISASIQGNTGKFIDLSFNKRILIPYGYCYILEDFSTKNFNFKDRVVMEIGQGDFDIFVTDTYQETLYSYPWHTFSIDQNLVKETRSYSYVYEVNIKRSILSEHDSKTNCMIYGEADSKYSSFSNCMEEEQYIDFLDILGCVNPFLTTNESRSCKTTFNQTYMKAYTDYTSSYLTLNIAYKQSITIPECPLPCTRQEISLRRVQKISSPTSAIGLFFRNDIMVSEAYQSFTFISLLVEIGSSVGFYLGLSCLSILDLVAYLGNQGSNLKTILK